MKDKAKVIVLDGNLVSETYINKVVDEGLKLPIECNYEIIEVKG